jgi:hypothetical protein
MGDTSWDVREDEHTLQGRVKLNCSKIWIRYVFSPFSKDQIQNQWLLHPLIAIVDSPTARSSFHHCWPRTLPIPKTHLHTQYITSARRQHIICTVHPDLATSCYALSPNRLIDLNIAVIIFEHAINLSLIPHGLVPGTLTAKGNSFSKKRNNVSELLHKQTFSKTLHPISSFTESWQAAYSEISQRSKRLNLGSVLS